MERRTVRIIENLDGTPGLIKLYPKGKILVISDENDSVHRQKSLLQKIRIFNLKDGVFNVIQTHFKKSISSANVYFDGRVIASLRDSNKNKERVSGNLAIIIPGQDAWQYQILGGHSLETKDCLIMGPRIITCEEDVKARHTLRLWGTEFYVRMELGRLSLQK
jgi:hypothetical protein